MKTILVLLVWLWRVVTLPFFVLDWCVFVWPVERRAKKWRHVAKVGDRVYYHNILGTTTHGEIFSIKGGEAGVRGNHSSGWHPLDTLYPEASR